MIVQKNINIWPQCYSTTEEPDRQCVRHGSSRHRSGPRVYGSPFNLRFTEGIGANPTHVFHERNEVSCRPGTGRFNLTGYRRRPTRDQGPAPRTTLCDGCGERPRLRAGPAPTPISDFSPISGQRPPPGHGGALGPGGSGRAGACSPLPRTWLAYSTQTPAPTPQRTLAEGCRTILTARSPYQNVVSRLLHRKERGGRGGQTGHFRVPEVFRKCSSEVTEREAGSRKKSLSRFPTKLKPPVRKMAY